MCPLKITTQYVPNGCVGETPGPPHLLRAMMAELVPVLQASGFNLLVHGWMDGWTTNDELMSLPVFDLQKDPIGGYQGIPINMTGIAEKLKSAGYATHLVGKVR